MKLLTNAVIFDGENEVLIGGVSVLIEGDMIREVTTESTTSDDAPVIDCDGRFLMPGLLDLHFHACSSSFDMHKLNRMPRSLLVSYSTKHLQDALQHGFTTVRDPVGGDVDLNLAIEQGLINGPRFPYGGLTLLQTGGHGDMRPAFEEDPCNCAYSGVICQIVDGVDQVREVAHDERRKVADHVKVLISGGITSPTDPIWMPQFTNEKTRAAVEEAERWRKYVAAHCHTNDGARCCAENGVRSIDHATNVTEDTAKPIAASDRNYAVPTLAVIHQIRNVGDKLGIHEDSQVKVAGILDQMLGSIETCWQAGVQIGLGTDIFGTEFHDMQAQEIRCRAEVDKPADILRSATSINAEIVQRGDVLGHIALGEQADLIVLETSPLDDLAVFERYSSEMPVVMRSGRPPRPQHSRLDVP